MIIRKGSSVLIFCCGVLFCMRPLVTVNTAMSADGKLSTRERRQVKISGKNDLSRVDRLKALSDAVMVGIGTVLADDPALTIKSPDLIEERRRQGKEDHPVRVVVDSRARIPHNAALLTRGPGRRVVAVSSRASQEKVKALEIQATVICTGVENVDLADLLERLAARGVKRLVVEGGGTLKIGRAHV